MIRNVRIALCALALATIAVLSPAAASATPVALGVCLVEPATAVCPALTMVNVTGGSSFTLNVGINGASGLNYYNMEEIRFDPAALTLVGNPIEGAFLALSGNCASVPCATDFQFAVNPSALTPSLSAISLTGGYGPGFSDVDTTATGSGLLAILNFSTNAGFSGSTSILFGSSQLQGGNGVAFQGSINDPDGPFALGGPSTVDATINIAPGTQAVVPEPATLSLLGVGALIGVVRRRRAQRLSK